MPSIITNMLLAAEAAAQHAQTSTSTTNPTTNSTSSTKAATAAATTTTTTTTTTQTAAAAAASYVARSEILGGPARSTGTKRTRCTAQPVICPEPTASGTPHLPECASKDWCPWEHPGTSKPSTRKAGRQSPNFDLATPLNKDGGSREGGKPQELLLTKIERSGCPARFSPKAYRRPSS